MKKQNKKKFEGWLNKQIAEYTNVLNLQAYQLQAIKHDKTEEDAIFRVFNNYPYKAYGIAYSDGALKMWEEKEIELLRYGVMHELVHVVLAELVAKAHARSTRQEIDDSMETTVDHLAVVLSRML